MIDQLVSLSLLTASLANLQISWCCLSATVNFLDSMRQLLLYFSMKRFTLLLIFSLVRVWLLAAFLVIQQAVWDDFMAFNLLLISFFRSTLSQLCFLVCSSPLDFATILLFLVLSWLLVSNWYFFSRFLYDTETPSVCIVLLCFNLPLGMGFTLTLTVLPLSCPSEGATICFYDGLFSYQRMDRLSDSKDKRFFRCFRMRQLLSSKCQAEVIIFPKVILLFYYRDYRFGLNIENRMSTVKEVEYGRKLALIEAKFRVICEKYQQVTEEARQKDECIARMGKQIDDLSSQLGAANNVIAELERQVRKAELMQKTYYLRHKSNVESNQLIESEPSTTNLYSRIKDLKNGVKSETMNAALSQQSIAPEQIKGKQELQKQSRDSIQSTLSKLKAKINSRSQIPIAGQGNSNDQIFVSSQPSVLSRVKSMESIKKIESKDGPNMKTLQKIWQERDTQISKMDELFESLSNKLKDYEE